MIVWFMCNKCGSTFLKLDQYINHKKQNHLEEYRKSKCIVFEEKLIEENIDEDSDSDTSPTNNASNSISTPILPSTSSTKTKNKSRKPESKSSKPTVAILPINPEPEPDPEPEFAFQQQPQADTEIEAKTDPLQITTKSSSIVKLPPIATTTTQIPDSRSGDSVDFSDPYPDPDDANSLASQEIKTEPLENRDGDFDSFEGCLSPVPVATSTGVDVKTELATLETDEEDDTDDSDSSSSSVLHVPTPKVVLVRRLSPRQTSQTASYKVKEEKKPKREPVKKPRQPVLCDICGLTFRIKSDLLEHKVVHSGPSRLIQWVEKGSFSSQEEAEKAVVTDKWKIQYTNIGATLKRVTYYCREHGKDCPVKVQLGYPVEQNTVTASSSGFTSEPPGNRDVASSSSLSKEQQKILFFESPFTEHRILEAKEKALSEPVKERMRRLMEQGITGPLRMLKTLDIQHNSPTLMQVRNFISRYRHLHDPKSIAKFKSGEIKAPFAGSKLKTPCGKFDTENFSNETMSTQ